MKPMGEKKEKSSCFNSCYIETIFCRPIFIPTTYKQKCTYTDTLSFDYIFCYKQTSNNTVLDLHEVLNNSQTLCQPSYITLYLNCTISSKFIMSQAFVTMKRKKDTSGMRLGSQAIELIWITVRN